MATESTLIPLGTQAPDFALTDVTTGTTVRRDDVSAGRALLVVFLCRHCPYVQHVKDELARLGRDYGERVGIVGISSNDATTYPDDAPASLAEFARGSGFTFPVLYDESQDVARAYGAVCTPDPSCSTATSVWCITGGSTRRGRDQVQPQPVLTFATRLTRCCAASM